MPESKNNPKCNPSQKKVSQKSLSLVYRNPDKFKVNEKGSLKRPNSPIYTFQPIPKPTCYVSYLHEPWVYLEVLSIWQPTITFIFNCSKLANLIATILSLNQFNPETLRKYWWLSQSLRVCAHATLNWFCLAFV